MSELRESSIYNQGIKSTIDLIKSYHKELTLFSCFGLDREKYGEYYDPTEKIYISTIPSSEYDPKNPTHRLKWEWELIPGDDELKEIKYRGLIKHRGKLFFPEKEVQNIYKEDKLYYNVLVCYDFTSALHRLLAFANGPPKVLVIPDKNKTCGYDYNYESPVSKKDQLSTLITRDGIYICQIKFTEEDHAFCIIIDGNKMTILNLYNSKFYAMESTLNDGLNKLRLLEENKKGINRDLVSAIFGMKDLFSGEYMILCLIQCDYWSRGFTRNLLAKFFLYVSDTAFKGRQEEQEITKIIKEIYEDPKHKNTDVYIEKKMQENIKRLHEHPITVPNPLSFMGVKYNYVPFDQLNKYILKSFNIEPLLQTYVGTSEYSNKLFTMDANVGYIFTIGQYDATTNQIFPPK